MRLMKFLNLHKVLYEGQYGFRPQRSTSDAILDLSGNILDAFNKGMYTLGLFLDMTKAFDCINHQTLFQKLELYGVRGIALDWIKSYMDNRRLKVNVDNVLSDDFSVSCGTPQGSVLGPLLYIIVANDMPKCMKFTSSIMFADDTTIFMSGRNLK
jgi:retron-type reverse transcriptase